MTNAGFLLLIPIVCSTLLWDSSTCYVMDTLPFSARRRIRFERRLAVEGSSRRSGAYGDDVYLSPTERKSAVWSFQKKSSHFLEDSNSHHNSSTFVLQASMDLLMQGARLGKGDRTVEVSKKIMRDEELSLDKELEVCRAVLHAWSNELKSLGMLEMTKRVRVRMSHAAKEAERALQRMERLITRRQQQQKAEMDRNNKNKNKPSSALPVLLTPLDYSTVINNYLAIEQTESAMRTTSRWLQGNLTEKPPNVFFISKVIRTSANYRTSTSWDEALEGARKAITLGEMYEKYLQRNPSSHHYYGKSKLKLLNAMLEVWSKILPPLGRAKVRQQNCNYSTYTLPQDELDVVGQGTKKIIDRLSESADTEPDFQTNALLLYAYSKCMWTEQAWEVWVRWKEELIFAEGEKERVDGRAIRMLVQSIGRQMEETEASDDHDDDDNDCNHNTLLRIQAQRASSIVQDMWGLHDLGYQNVAPDVYLYTTVVNAWSRLSASWSPAVESTKYLVRDLNNRYEVLKWKSLKPDVALYNTLVTAVGSSSAHDEMDTNSVAIEAESIVTEMKELSQDNPMLAPDTITYNILMNTHLRSSNFSLAGVQKAEEILSSMIEETSLRKDDRVAPTGQSYAAVINGWAKHDTLKAKEWLERMEEHHRPSTSLFETLILACCEQVEKEEKAESQSAQVERAQSLLRRLGKFGRPKRSLHDSVIKALLNCGSEESAIGLESIRQKNYHSLEEGGTRGINSDAEAFNVLEEELGEAAPWTGVPAATTFNFNLVLKQLALCGKDWAGKRAEDIFQYMMDQYVKDDGNMEIKPDIVTVNSVISAWAKSSHPESASRAHDMLESLDTLHDKGLLLDVQADLISYNTIIHAYARNGNMMSAKNANHVFQRLSMMFKETNDDRYKPDIFSYSSLLNAWASTGAAQRAEQLLMSMHDNYKKDPRNNVQPNKWCYDQVLYAWAKSDYNGAAKRGAQVLSLMEDMSSSGKLKNDVHPDTQTYNIVLYSMANSNDADAPFKAQMLLERMKEDSKNDESNSSSRYPDAVSYTTVISAWCRLGGRQTFAATERLVKEAIESDTVEVDEAFFANTLYSLAFSDDKWMPQNAEKLLKKMTPIRLKPDINVYNALLHCWAKSGNRLSSQRVQEILLELEESNSSEEEKMNNQVQPDVQTYTTVLDCLAKSREPDAVFSAESVFQRMEENTSIQPNVKTYTALIQNYARSDIPRKSVLAQEVLEKMKNGPVMGQPNIISYNSVLNACEYTKSSELRDLEAAFKVACVTFDEIRSSSSVRPNHVTFGTFLGAIANLMPRSESRLEIVELVFKRCCVDAQVSPYVMKKLREAASPLLYKRLLEGNSEDKLPSKWTAKVNMRKHRGGNIVFRT